MGVNDLNEPIEFANGHKLVDNKVGDYDLICPEHGFVGFVPFFFAWTATENKICNACKKTIGKLG